VASVLVPDLLKNRRDQQLFAVFGEPDARLDRSGTDFKVEFLGMDVYDPSSGEVSSAGTDGVAAWFLDTDYDRRSFLVSQAFFPGSAGGADPWARLGRALRGWVDPDAFEMLRGTVSLPFSRGEHGRAAVKVIDFRGNEAIKILALAQGVRSRGAVACVARGRRLRLGAHRGTCVGRVASCQDVGEERAARLRDSVPARRRSASSRAGLPGVTGGRQLPGCRGQGTRARAGPIQRDCSPALDSCVNHWGKLGQWRYAKIHLPHQLESVLAVKPEWLESALHP